MSATSNPQKALEQLAQAVFEITVWDGQGNGHEILARYQRAEKLAKKHCPDLYKAEKAKLKEFLKTAY